MGTGAPAQGTLPPLEERKVVTVITCLLEPAGETDPEDWRAVLDRSAAGVSRGIEGFGGTVLGQMAGTIAGVFGVPIAHEDDAERAVRAGLRILQEVTPTDLTEARTVLRIGVSTGEALVSLGHEDRPPVAGNVVGDAAQLGSAAAPSQVVVDRRTHRLTGRAIGYEELEALTPEGEPVPCWRALGPIARSGTPESDRTPFVGREAELSMLTRLFERSRTRPSTEFVTIVAEPGLGKSRLVRELARSLDALPELVTWRVGRCLPYGEGISFWALGEIVRSHAGILETDEQSAISDKVDAVLAEPESQTRTWMKDRLAPLVA